MTNEPHCENASREYSNDVALERPDTLATLLLARNVADSVGYRNLSYLSVVHVQMTPHNQHDLVWFLIGAGTGFSAGFFIAGFWVFESMEERRDARWS